MPSRPAKTMPWPLLIGAKFLQVHPIGTVCAVLLALPAQLAVIASFLLPIKIVMLMASEGMPTFVPEIAQNIEKKEFVTILAILSVSAFIFTHISSKLIQKFAESGAKKLEARNQKLHLFENQSELTKTAYTKYIETVSSVNFVVIGILLLTYLYPEVGLTFTFYLLALIVSVLAYKTLQCPETENLAELLLPKLQGLVGLGFFLIFFTVLGDYLFFQVPENFIVLIAAVILGRQLLTQSSVIARNSFFFQLQKRKLRSLLLHNEKFEPITRKSSNLLNFLDRRTPEYHKLQDILTSLNNTENKEYEMRWRDSGLRGIGVLTARVSGTDNQFLVKVFSPPKAMEARHEATLLLSSSNNVPCPSLIFETEVSGMAIHIFDIQNFCFPDTVSAEQGSKFVELLSEVPAPRFLASRYSRSRTMLWDQLDQLKLDQLELITEDKALVGNFRNTLPLLKEQLKTLPLTIFNPNKTQKRLYIQNHEGDIQLYHWGKWSIEPMGAGVERKFAEKLSERTLESGDGDALLAHLSHQLKSQIERQMLYQALNTIEALTSILQKYQSQ